MSKLKLRHDAEYTTRLRRWASLNQAQTKRELTVREAHELRVLSREMDEIEARMEGQVMG